MFEESKESNFDWNRAFFARLIALLGLPPFIYTLISAFMVPNEHHGANERLVLAASSISLVFFLSSVTISHVPYLRRREAGSMWHFGIIEMGIVVVICALLIYLLFASGWILLHLPNLR